MQFPILRTYELDFYDSVRLFLKEDSRAFKYLSGSGFQKLHNVSGRIFIKGKFIKIKITEELSESDLPAAQKYYFIETSDVIHLSDPYLLELAKITDIPDYVLEIHQTDIISIELLLDYTVK